MKSIKAGDVVSVHIHGAQVTLTAEAIVKHVPVATGDSWELYDVLNEQTFFISEGCTLVRNEVI